MRCGICGSDTVVIHHGTRDNPSINVYRCTRCHTKQLDNIVDNDYENGFMNGKSFMNEEEIEQRLSTCREDDLRRVDATIDWCKGKKVLDFGCGFGGYMRYLSQDSCTVSGVELGTTEREYLNKKGYDVKRDLSEFSQLFDVITLFHVFEHLKDPELWLNRLADKLSNDGIMFIEVPNADDALLELYDCKEFASFTYWSAHLYLYTVDSLSNIVKQSGRFTIESADQIQRYPLSNHLFWLSQGKPGGHQKWLFLDSPELKRAYEDALSKNGLCDTLFFRLRKSC